MVTESAAHCEADEYIGDSLAYRKAVITGKTPGVLELADRVAANAIRSIELAQIVPNRDNIRKTWDAELLLHLRDSIKINGIFVPPIIQPIGDGLFAPIDGSRRIEAYRLAGLTAPISCIVVEGVVTLARAREIALTIHMTQVSPNFIDTARAMDELKRLEGLSNVELAQRIGVCPATVSKHLSVLELPAELLATPGLSLNLAYEKCRKPRKKLERKKRLTTKLHGVAMTLLTATNVTAKAIKAAFTELASTVAGVADDAPLADIAKLLPR